MPQYPADSVEPVAPRRSTRTTAGRHSNPHHLLESSVRITSNHVVADVTPSLSDFMQFIQALVGLGEMLAERLGGRLQAGWSAFRPRRYDDISFNVKEL